MAGPTARKKRARNQVMIKKKIQEGIGIMNTEGGKKGERNPLNQLPWQRVQRVFDPIELLSEEQIEAIHRTSLKILQDTGVRFVGKKARDFLSQVPGVRVNKETEIVRFDSKVVEEAVGLAPEEFKIHARNPAHDILVGGNNISFTNTITPPYVNDLDHGKRPGTEVEFRDLLKLCQSLHAIHFVFGYPVEPQDLAVETRHLDAYRAHITLTDKIWRLERFAYSDRKRRTW